MRYLLDLALVIGLIWIGYLWDKERKAGLALSDQIASLEARMNALETDLAAARETGTQTDEKLAAAQAQIEKLSKELLDKTDALNAKTTEAEALKAAAVRLKERVAELEGYKAKAAQAEMRKPAGP